MFGQRDDLLWNEIEMMMKLVMNDVEKSYFSSLKMVLWMVSLISEYNEDGLKQQLVT